VQQLANTPWFQRDFVNEVPMPALPSPSGDLVQGSYIPPTQRDYSPPEAYTPLGSLDDVLTAVAVAGSALVAPEALPVAGAVADVGTGVAMDSAVFLSTPAGQVLTSYAASQLGGTGLPPSNVPSFLGGTVLPALGAAAGAIVGEEDAW
jgi:hypothetical protein